MNRQNIKKAYFVGIKGVGMTALATYMKQKGINVSGSDVEDEFHTDEALKTQQIEVKKGFNTENVPKDTDLVIVTGAHGSLKNPESLRAKDLGIKTIPHGQALGEEMQGKTQISIAGCHGKTTTTAMVATIFNLAKLDPSYILGAASIAPLGSAGQYGEGKYFIAEADEYLTAPGIDNTPRFLWQYPNIAVITNIEFDHPDAYKNLEQIYEAYSKFVSHIPKDGILVINIDDANNIKLLKNLTSEVNIVTYGFSKKADVQIKEYKMREGVTCIVIKNKKGESIELKLQIPGKHNAQNAVAAYCVASAVNISPNIIKSALFSFKGAKRRFEKVGNLGNILLYDDYAHHPTEIIATYDSFKEMYPERRIILVFQPHTYSRTEVMEDEFIKTFLSIKDPVVVTDIFASKRENTSDVISSKKIVEKIRARGGINVNYMGNFSQTLEYLQKILMQNDVIVTMGAGDVYKIHELFKKKQNQ